MINLGVNPPLAPPPQINSLPLISSLFQWKKVNSPPPPLSIVVGMNWQMHITVTVNSYETFLGEHVLGPPYKFVSPTLNVCTLHPVPLNATEHPGAELLI